MTAADRPRCRVDGRGLLVAHSQLRSGDGAAIWANLSRATLATGASYTQTQSVMLSSASARDGYILVVADNNQAQAESDYTNNAGASPLSQLRRCFLAWPSPPPRSPRRPARRLGESIAVSWSVENTGSTPTTSNWSDDLYVSDNATFDSSAQLLGTYAANRRFAGGRSELQPDGGRDLAVYADGQPLSVAGGRRRRRAGRQWRDANRGRVAHRPFRAGPGGERAKRTGRRGAGRAFRRVLDGDQQRQCARGRRVAGRRLRL